jgi:ketosteroid isomerase-like protein
MSRENVDVVVKQFADTNARDFEAVMEAYAEDVVLVFHAEELGLLGPLATGKVAVGEWFGDWFRQFGRDYRFDIEESRGLGDRVLVIATHHGRGRDSGVPVEESWAYAYTVREGKVSRVELWRGPSARAAALDAVGLDEQLPSA